jgi:hypothetical protein
MHEAPIGYLGFIDSHIRRMQSLIFGKGVFKLCSSCKSTTVLKKRELQTFYYIANANLYPLKMVVFWVAAPCSPVDIY